VEETKPDKEIATAMTEQKRKIKPHLIFFPGAYFVVLIMQTRSKKGDRLLQTGTRKKETD